METGSHIRLVLWKAAKAVEKVDRESIDQTGLGLSDFTIMEALQPPIRVVPADDQAVVRAGIRQILEHTGEIQVVADDGERAKSLIQQKLPDVAVLDIQMPKASGIE